VQYVHHKNEASEPEAIDIVYYTSNHGCFGICRAQSSMILSLRSISKPGMQKSAHTCVHEK
jgi:hypothetical protein